MLKLDNVVQPYAWGSRTAIAELLGRPSPSPTPEAELWMGAHPAAPSRVPSLGVDLAELVARDANDVLGASVLARYGGFPFLLKVLAAAEPLSIQAHPSKAQAEAGFRDEETRGIPRGAPHRNYKDANHKPELLCALSRFEALCGFRDLRESVALLDELAVPELQAERELLATRGAPEGLREAFRLIMSRPPAAREDLLAHLRAACTRSTASAFAPSIAWTLRLADQYPGDVGAVSALLLNHVVLAPGEAIYLPAGNLHAYLAGVGVEIMASSDNVLRGGLTTKHVDVPELLRVLELTAGPITPLRPRPVGDEDVYETPAPDFRLSHVSLREHPKTFTTAGPEIVLCIDGAATLTSRSNTIALARGETALVLAADGRWEAAGRGALYRATVGS